MKYAIMLGSNVLIGTTGILIVEEDNEKKEFFRVRKLRRERSSGEYIVIDCDIKDIDGKREVKIFKNKPVASTKRVYVDYTKKMTAIKRENGSTIIKIEKIEKDNDALPQDISIKQVLDQMDEILRITGSFYAGHRLVEMDADNFKIEGNIISGNILIGTGGIFISRSSIAL